MRWWTRGSATRDSEWRRGLRRLWRSRLAVVGAIIGVSLVVGIFAPWIAPYSPTRINLRERLKSPQRGPSLRHR
ncbi:hypothetical protein LR090_06650 [Candidatus Bipolaricaulota bacterium]|nr:hypothetical protein [Candidatus Bipolaricaulota bacterium]